MQDYGPIEKEILDKSFTFPMGLPGFPGTQRFVFSQGEGEHPFALMRSLDNANLSFAVIEAFYLKPDYVMDVDDDDLDPIGGPSPMDCLIFFILKIEGGKPFRIYANLKAPLILHKDKKLGRQIVLPDSPYSERELFEF